MTPELEKYYNSYFDLFLTDGWKQFVEDVKESASSFDVRYVQDENALKFIQGQLTVMDKLINWQASIETAYADIEANGSADESE